jgi:drug/metabolite transporter (DMT)-like permease
LCPEGSELTQTKIAGIVLVVVGIGLAYWGYQGSGALSSQLNEAMSGSPSDNVMIKYISGAAAAAAGAFLFVKK